MAHAGGYAFRAIAPIRTARDVLIAQSMRLFVGIIVAPALIACTGALSSTSPVSDSGAPGSGDVSQDTLADSAAIDVAGMDVVNDSKLLTDAHSAAIDAARMDAATDSELTTDAGSGLATDADSAATTNADSGMNTDAASGSDVAVTVDADGGCSGQTARFHLDAPMSWRYGESADTNASGGNWLTIYTQSGELLDLYWTPSLSGLDCRSCDSGTYGNAPGSVWGNVPDGGLSSVWNGTYYAPGTCPGSSLACVAPACAAPGQYSVEMCACPPENWGAGGCTLSTGPVCATTLFDFPSSLVVSEQVGLAAPDAGSEGGGGCSSSEQCPEGQFCVYSVAAGCSAGGVCVDDLLPGEPTCQSATAACGCNGQIAYEPCFLTGFATAPVVPGPFVDLPDGGCM
jgi:hypothetical protein